MKQLTIYPYDPIQIENGLTCIAADSSRVVWQLAQFFNGENDTFATYSQNGKIVDNKEIVYVGDIAVLPQFEKMYGKQLVKLIQKHIDSELLEQLYTLDMQMRSKLNMVCLNNDLPVALSSDWDLTMLLKYVGVHVEVPVVTGFCDIIVSIIDLANRLHDDSLFVLMNVRNNLSDQQIIQLSSEARMKQVSILLLDRTTFEDAQVLVSDDIKSVYIDQDFVDFRGNELK